MPLNFKTIGSRYCLSMAPGFWCGIPVCNVLFAASGILVGMLQQSGSLPRVDLGFELGSGRNIKLIIFSLHYLTRQNMHNLKNHYNFIASFNFTDNIMIFFLKTGPASLLWLENNDVIF